MARYTRREAADRAGVVPNDVDRLIDQGLIVPDGDGTLGPGDIRKIGLLASLFASGIPETALADALRTGRLSLGFLDSPSFAPFSALSSTTFRELSDHTGVPLGLLLAIREAIGSGVAEPDDFVREIEQSIVPLIEAERAVGYPDDAVERLLRNLGESLRRYVQAEADAFQQHVVIPVSHLPGEQISAAARHASDRLGRHADEAALAILHAEQAHAWTSNILEGFAGSLAEAGVYSPLDRPPAMCFLDITGYTRLTEERGNRAAAELAEQLARLVRRISVKHGGRPVKWLGDGVMFWFREPGGAVVAALEMSRGVTDAGLPPAHVGVDAGPVLSHDGDYYGQTVNVASRIASYARPGEVLVSQAVVEDAAAEPVIFNEIGPVELKGVTTPVTLFAASLARGPE